MKRPRKTIAIVANSTWNIYNFRLGLIRALRQQGFRIIVIAPIDEYMHYLNELKFIQHVPLKRLHPHSKNPWLDLQLLLELYSIFSMYQPDLILNYTIKPNIFGNFAARLAGIPTVATLTGLGYTFLSKNWINQIVARLYKWALQHPIKVVFHNPDDLQSFKRAGLVKPAKALVIPGSGVNTEYFQPLPKPRTGRFIFLFIGRLLYDKGLIETVEAIREVKKWAGKAECWVIGELSPKNPMAIPKDEVLAWQQEGIIKYFGRREDVRSLIQRADVVMLPSYREGLPKAILEAMAMAKPILTTDVPGCKETVIDGRNGFLVPVKAVPPLVEHMLRLYQSEEAFLQQLGDYSRSMVCKRFSSEKVTQAYLEMILALPGFQRQSCERPAKHSSAAALNIQYAEG